MLSAGQEGKDQENLVYFNNSTANDKRNAAGTQDERQMYPMAHIAPSQIQTQQQPAGGPINIQSEQY